MNDQKIKELCIALMKAETEIEVIELLKEVGYWDNTSYWRYYGDKENNYSSAGNQADEAESALVEKITNSRDAILMLACLLRGIDPKSSEAPNSVQDAVAHYFEDNPDNELAGQIKEWSKDKRREVAKNLSVYISGHKPAKDLFPCINIADKGEGQTPLDIPRTILSLGESIKRKIRFVHGKWNMGGTAALVYCGNENLQLIISKRNPQLLVDETIDITDRNWGFTIVRREDPIGGETTSTYKYLAPLGENLSQNKGDLLNFYSDTLPIFAKYNEPYSVESKWGTLVKLYEYETKYKQNVQGSGGILRPLDLLAPDLGLPFRLHECRYDGTPGSFEHQVNGLKVRLFDDKGNSLEHGYPMQYNAVIAGEKFTFTLYAFKDDKAKTYRDAEKGVIFTLNGQSQGWLDDRIFTRNKVGLGFLKNSLFVIVDCSNLNYRAQEKLFVNDRVHLRKGPFREKIENVLVDYLSNHQGLTDLQEERKRKLKADKLDDSKPLESVLSNVFKHSSALSKIFLKGQRLSNAFKSQRVKGQDFKYKGKQYPTYFKFRKIEYGKLLKRDAFLSTKSRIGFETDAENDYLIRKTKPGYYKLFVKTDNALIEAKDKKIDYGLKLENGIATLNIDIDSEFLVNDKVKFIIHVSDPMRIVDPPFENEFELHIKPKPQMKSGGNTGRSKPPTKIPGKDRDKEYGISFPKIYPVKEEGWKDHEFDEYSALRVVRERSKTDDKQAVEFTFYVNMDNIYLQHEVKDNIEEKKTLNAYFEFGMALLGISIIYDDQQNKDDDNKYDQIEERIRDFSRAMAPMLIPMIKEFGDLDLKSDLLEQLAD